MVSKAMHGVVAALIVRLAASLRRVGFLFIFCLVPTVALGQEDQPQQVLDEGYSQLYAEVLELQRVYRDLPLKQQGSTTEKLVGDLASYIKILEGDLRELAVNNGIRIDLQPLPEAELRRRRAAAAQRISGFAPVGGRVGRDFERELLLALVTAVRQLQFLAAELEDAEQAGERQRRMARAVDRLDALHSAFLRHLNAHFFLVDQYAS